jgi:hypothetical protein
MTRVSAHAPSRTSFTVVRTSDCGLLKVVGTRFTQARPPPEWVAPLELRPDSLSRLEYGQGLESLQLPFLALED